MKKSTIFVILLWAAVAVIAGTGTQSGFFKSRFQITVTASEPKGIQEDSRLYMSGIPIGKVRDVSLKSPGTVAFDVVMDPGNEGYINISTVFTVDADPEQPGRKALVCKTCDEQASAVQTGHAFAVLNDFRYKTACLEQKTQELIDRATE